MTYNEFKLRFAIQYVGGVSDPGEAIRRMDNAPALARLLWDVMNAPEVEAPPAPSFVSTATIAPIPPNSRDLKMLAERAVEVSDGIAKYIAIDKHGAVYAYKQKPIIKSDVSTCWDISDLRHPCWLVDHVAEPAVFRNELYKISKLLNDGND